MKVTLAEIVENKKREVEERKIALPLAELQHNISPGVGHFLNVLKQPGVNLIAEFKPMSPSAGVLRESKSIDVNSIIKTYSRYASAISVLTDQKYFGGSIQLLAEIAMQTETPLLCKDFIIDTYQAFEARVAGAEAALLIVKILTDEQLHRLHGQITELGMTAVVEVQNEEEVKRALDCNVDILLINNRNLSDFQIDLETTTRLAHLIPPSIPFISASGIENAADIEKLLPVTNKFLVGSSIMRSKNIEAKLKELCGVTSRCVN